MTYKLQCPRCHRTDSVYPTGEEDTGGKIYRCSRCFWEGHPDNVYIPVFQQVKKLGGNADNSKP